ncbi:MAG: anion permease [Hyphomicrobiales bacterium]|nr:anion permease [Hyphomicrobiales bacterium]
MGSVIVAPAIAYAVAFVATAGVMARPFRWPEYVFALAGAAALLVLRVLSPAEAWGAVVKGTDVYLFLTGMMLLSEVARREGLFDWAASRAAALAQGDPRRLFALVYGVGVLVTVFLSNDATAVVLTPAVYAAARAAKAPPTPYLYACAFVANAASFVLPISNPANLVMFGDRMPPLGAWLALFAAPSLAAILLTYGAMRFVFAGKLGEKLGQFAHRPEQTPLSFGGRIACAGLCAAALVLLYASARGWNLGLPTLVVGLAVAAVALTAARAAPGPVLREISWGVLPLVAGLFVLVEGLARAGLVAHLAEALQTGQAVAPRETALVAGLLAGFGANVVNNLPLGLIAASAAHQAAASPLTIGALLIGVDLGPNLSVTGSLATLLWLVAIRREGEHVGALAFLKVGAVVMTPSLIASLAALILS